jgi:hypothetical protein
MKVRFFIDGPDGLISFDAEHTKIPLPWGLDPGGAAITYGPYFTAIADFLSGSDWQALLTALGQHLDRVVFWQEIESIEVISQKHGAFYHVAQLRVEISGRVFSLALNCAFGAQKQTFLESEFALLRELNKRFPLGMIPSAYVLGGSPGAVQGGGLALRAFIAEWFEGFHEFHLSRKSVGESPGIKVWGVRNSESFLDAHETLLLYSQASAILTAYFDAYSFQQIYPWHHAAGDFILKKQQDGVELRLITVRGYRPLLTLEPGGMDKWIPIVHFFINLSLRMRLDRLDGTGEMVWANSACLHGVVSGFLKKWEQKAKDDPGLPAAPQVLEVLRSFTHEEWLPFAGLVLDDGLVEADEFQFIQPRLEEHVVSLCEVLKAMDG